LVRSSHPVPNVKSVVAAKKIIEFLKFMEATDLVVFLISGGASSLVSLPDGISLQDKQLVTRLLLRSGANIREINCVRAHLSKIKGGRLVGSLRCKAVSLVMSDVVGDDLSVIASGMTYCDKSTFCDAKKVLIKYRLKNLVPKSVWQRIILGTNGMIPETPKKPKIQNYIIQNNKNCVDLMKTHAQKLGFVTKAIYSIKGNVEDAASKISKHVPNSQNFCLVFGGETTVVVKGKGRGGRNQELVLNLLKKLKDRGKKITMVSVGTDGMDGNTRVAGAIADSVMPSEPIDKYLNENDSYHYFKKYGGLVFTGSTHTNLMDIGLILLRK
jgi:glycerate 2-kinase